MRTHATLKAIFVCTLVNLSVAEGRDSSVQKKKECPAGYTFQLHRSWGCYPDTRPLPSDPRCDESFVANLEDKNGCLILDNSPNCSRLGLAVIASTGGAALGVMAASSNRSIEKIVNRLFETVGKENRNKFIGSVTIFL